MKEYENKKREFPDFEGSPLEFLETVYKNAGASIRLRCECAQFLVNYHKEAQREKKETLPAFKGEAIDLHKAAYKNENLPLKTRLECAKYVTEYEIRQKQLELPLNDRMSTIVTLKPVRHETATEKGITEEVH